MRGIVFLWLMNAPTSFLSTTKLHMEIIAKQSPEATAMEYTPMSFGRKNMHGSMEIAPRTVNKRV